jgi:hypothetical protein
MMIEGDGEQKRDGEEDAEQKVEACAGERQADEVGEEHRELGREHIRDDGSDKEALFTFEERAARGAVMPDLKRSLDD